MNDAIADRLIDYIEDGEIDGDIVYMTDYALSRGDVMLSLTKINIGDNETDAVIVDMYPHNERLHFNFIINNHKLVHTVKTAIVSYGVNMLDDLLEQEGY